MVKRVVTKTVKITQASSVYNLWGWVLLAWVLYRGYAKFPEWVDELIAKPLAFVAPVLWYVRRIEKQKFASIGLTLKRLSFNLGIGLFFGVIFLLEGLIANFSKYGQIQLSPFYVAVQYGIVSLVILSFFTAFCEEILSRGFIFNRLYTASKNMIGAALISTVLFAALHIPILVTSLKFQGATLILFFLTDFIIGMTNSLLMAYTGSLVAPILVHLFWNVTVALFI